MSKCPTCGLSTRPGAARCELCRCQLPRRRHPRPAFANRPAPPLPPLPGKASPESVNRFLDQLSAELVKTHSQLSPAPPRWLKALAWTMLAGSVASGVALAALLLGLPTP